MAKASDRPLTVGGLTRRISDALGTIGTVSVRGELSRVQVVQSGHCYATLKDADAQIGIVMWRSTVARHGPLPKEGDAVVVRGSISVYGPRGQYQLVATRMAPEGVGDLAARFEALKIALAEAGLFDDEHKKDLPLLPSAIGLATAAGSAALADLLHGIDERFPSMPTIHAPCLVQGDAAPQEIIWSLEVLDSHPEVGVIVVGRGGGSLEDLWAFNDERVVRAIHACQTPVVSAVGHETDTTLADLVADRRAKTPTAAIEIALPNEADLRETLDSYADELHTAIDERMNAAHLRLDALAAHRGLSRPAHLLAMRIQRLDDLRGQLDHQIDRAARDAHDRYHQAARSLGLLHPRQRYQQAHARLHTLSDEMARSAHHRLANLEQRFMGAAGKLDALSPLGVIARGYSVVRTPDGTVVRRLDQAPPGTAIRARLSDGWLEAETTGSQVQRLREAQDFYQAGSPQDEGIS